MKKPAHCDACGLPLPGVVFRASNASCSVLPEFARTKSNCLPTLHVNPLLSSRVQAALRRSAGLVVAAARAAAGAGVVAPAVDADVAGVAVVRAVDVQSVTEVDQVVEARSVVAIRHPNSPVKELVKLQASR